MSKLIVEMEMPKLMCVDCEISIDGFACKKARTNGGKCPIKGVLPDEHGDLIDRSLLCADLCGVILSHSGLGVDEVIARQNAVIAAERKDDGRTD